MPVERPAIEPIRINYKVQFLTNEQLDQMQEATLQIMEDVGVKFPSEKALALFADHGAQVDHETQIVKLPRDLVRKAMATVPRYFNVGARDPACDFHLEDGVTYFCTDGCGVETIDPITRQRETRSYTRREYVPVWPPGNTPLLEMVYEEALDILHNHLPPPLPEGAADKIEVIVAEADEALA